MAKQQALYFEDVKEGDQSPPFVVQNISRTDIVRYAGASGDFNPIHHDQTFAEAAGLPTVFGHGMLTAGFAGKCVTDYVGRQNLRAFRVRFATRVWPGDSITCTATVTKKYEAGGQQLIDGQVLAVNQKGEAAIHGSFTAALPSRA